MPSKAPARGKKRKVPLLLQNPGSDEDYASDDEAIFEKEVTVLTPKPTTEKDGATFTEPIRRMVFHYYFRLLITEKGGEAFVNVGIAYVTAIRGSQVRTGDYLSIPADRLVWLNQTLRSFGQNVNDSAKDILITDKAYEVARLKAEKALWNGTLSIGVYVMSKDSDDAVIRLVRTFNGPKKGQKFEKKEDQMVEFPFLKYYNGVCKVLRDIQVYDKKRTKGE